MFMWFCDFFLKKTSGPDPEPVGFRDYRINANNNGVSVTYLAARRSHDVCTKCTEVSEPSSEGLERQARAGACRRVQGARAVGRKVPQHLA